MKKVFFLLSLLLALFTSCSNDFSENDLTLQSDLQKQESKTELANFLVLYDVDGEPIIVPNGECLVGAILSAGRECGMEWNPAVVRQAVEAYCGKMSLDVEGQPLGFPFKGNSFQDFLKQFFKIARNANLTVEVLKDTLGKNGTAIGIVFNDDHQTAHAYNIQSYCHSHKPCCYICYDAVEGKTVHLKGSAFDQRFSFYLAGPKKRISRRDDD